MRATISILFATAVTVLGIAPLAHAAEPAGDAAPKVPHMSREEALAYIAAEQLALDPTNLVSPIIMGKVELVEALLSAGVDVSSSELPQPALQLAVSACSAHTVETPTILAMIEVLLAHGAKVNPPGTSELSPLMVAVQQCPPAVVRRLLRAGADLRFRTSLGISTLAMALLVKNYDTAEVLIDAGARLGPEAASKLLAGNKGDARLVALVKRARAK
ncbi:MAG TPA: ankyrin repeat domain-containing protein [Thermoanaerobaculia bacterium]